MTRVYFVHLSVMKIENLDEKKNSPGKYNLPYLASEEKKKQADSHRNAALRNTQTT